MRLSLSTLIALIGHGVVFGVVTAVVGHASRPQVVPDAVPDAVEMEVVAAKPDPIADAPAAVSVSDARSTSARLRPRPVRRPPSAPTTEPAATVSPMVADAPESVASLAIAVHPAPGTVSAMPRSRPAAASTGSALTATPRYRTNPTPEYPTTSRRRREEGVVLLSVAVEASGVPSAISLNHTSGYPLLDQAALDAVRRWTFEPARAAGVPVFSTVVVPVRFSLTEGP